MTRSRRSSRKKATAPRKKTPLKVLDGDSPAVLGKGAKHRVSKRGEQSPSPGAASRNDKSSAFVVETASLAGEARFIYGRHAVSAVLANPARRIHTIVVTRAGGKWLAEQGFRDTLIAHHAREMSPDDLSELLPEGSVHQGVGVLAEPLEPPALEEIDSLVTTGPVIILDQVTDPQNIGAILRSAAAFDARAVIVQERHSPPITGALAKAAAGALEQVPLIRVVNIARALESLKQQHFFCIGLTGEGSEPVGTLQAFDRAALVLGAEGSGLRPLVAKSCDVLSHIPIHPQSESLNVAAATAVALYALTISAGRGNT